jgi:hypothetical protein
MSAPGDTEFRVHELCTKQSWWKVPHLVKLNIMLLVPFFSSYIGGFDGSMLNGVQTLKHWQEGSYQQCTEESSRDLVVPFESITC